MVESLSTVHSMREDHHSSRAHLDVNSRPKPAASLRKRLTEVECKHYPSALESLVNGTR